jgi:hypothetical protein
MEKPVPGFRGSEDPLATSYVLVAVAFAAPNAASAGQGIVALSGETLHLGPADPLLDFGSGRTVSLVPHMPALARHAAANPEIVLLSLETGAVRTAEEALAGVVLYDELGASADVARLVREPGSVLLFETPAGTSDPRAAPLARLAHPSGRTLTLYFDRSFTPAPEPGVWAGLAAGALLVCALRRRVRH